jgi:hypothetical protein
MRGDGVGVGLADGGGAVVGIGIVVGRVEELADGGAAHETRRSAMRVTAPRRVPREGHFSSVGVF